MVGAVHAGPVAWLFVVSIGTSALGGALGMVLARIGVRALLAVSPPDMPRLAAIQVNMPVFIFGFGVTILIGLAVGREPGSLFPVR